MAIDYEKLLRKYVLHVLDNEGTDFLGVSEVRPRVADTSEEETDALMRIRNEMRAEHDA